jgi:hypothetical protein
MKNEQTTKETFQKFNTPKISAELYTFVNKKIYVEMIFAQPTILTFNIAHEVMIHNFQIKTATQNKNNVICLKIFCLFVLWRMAHIFAIKFIKMPAKMAQLVAMLT